MILNKEVRDQNECIKYELDRASSLSVTVDLRKQPLTSTSFHPGAVSKEFRDDEFSSLATVVPCSDHHSAEWAERSINRNEIVSSAWPGPGLYGRGSKVDSRIGGAYKRLVTFSFWVSQVRMPLMRSCINAVSWKNRGIGVESELILRPQRLPQAHKLELMRYQDNTVKYYMLTLHLPLITPQLYLHRLIRSSRLQC
ncbi:hypothetical protein PoB_002643300 [Plakobranchus ocellatus]|uniref:Uncharacterized protein n=1 Tax=Plakobranchus ocellatus TaxID=259542 RepID=A0AAV3ZZQ6_9GAST|nr:hypothetical protein PoB_002643300 [Plakobranchus ocellatus]